MVVLVVLFVLVVLVILFILVVLDVLVFVEIHCTNSLDLSVSLHNCAVQSCGTVDDASCVLINNDDSILSICSVSYVNINSCFTALQAAGSFIYL